MLGFLSDKVILYATFYLQCNVCLDDTADFFFNILCTSDIKSQYQTFNFITSPSGWVVGGGGGMLNICEQKHLNKILITYKHCIQ